MTFGVLLAVSWAVGLALGAHGLAEHLRDAQPKPTELDIAYRTVKLINLGGVDSAGHLPLTLELARWLLPLLAATTLIGGLSFLFSENLRWARIQRRGRHVVVCGLSRKGYLLSERFGRDGGQVVVIDRDRDNGWLEECRLRGDLVIVGDATAPAVLRKAAVAKAAWVFAVCNSEGTNAEIAVKVREEINKKKPASVKSAKQFGGSGALPTASILPTVRCRAHLADPDLGRWLGHLGVLDPNDDDEPGLVEAFNVFELGAPLLLDDHDPFVDGAGRSIAHPGILVIGLGCFGAMVVVEASRRWALRRPAAGPPLHIVALALDAREKVDLLRVEYEEKLAAADIEPIELNVRGAAYRRGEYILREDGKPKVNYVYVCLDEDALGIRAALALRNRLSRSIPIVVRVGDRTGLGALLPEERTSDGKDHNVYAFPLLPRTCERDAIRL